jgi:5S rRNA maturation endonuclease (ribonuclease M5)
MRNEGLRVKHTSALLHSFTPELLKSENNMEKYELQKLRDLPIEGVAERLGLGVSRHKSLCPFHDDRHPSMSYHVGKNTFRCFVCGAHGGVIDLVMKYRNVDFLEACRWLGAPEAIEWHTAHTRTNASPSGDKRGAFGTFDASRYERFFERPWLSPEARRFLFDERRIDPRVAAWCRLTSWRDKQGVSWLQIPYYDMEGKLVGVQNRRITASSGASPCPSEGGVNGRETSPSPSKGGENGETLAAKRADETLASKSPSFGGVGEAPPPPRFRFPYGSRCSIYNLPVMKMLRPHEPLYITEGCSDCWAMLSAGNKAIAIPSATLLMAKDVEMISELVNRLSTPLHMFPDRDEPGERLFMQLKQLLPNLEHHQLPLGYKDFGEWWGKEAPT